MLPVGRTATAIRARDRVADVRVGARVPPPKQRMVLGPVGNRGSAPYQNPVGPPTATAEVRQIDRYPPADAAATAWEEGVEVGPLGPSREAGPTAHIGGHPRVR